MPDSKTNSDPQESAPELQPAPLAYLNPDFLNSPDGRIVRILSEYAEPLSRFRHERIQDTVVFFGSARFGDLEQAKQKSGDDHSSAQHSNAKQQMARYYEDARLLARMLTEWTMTLPGRRA